MLYSSVSRMPWSARCYLAVMAMLILLLLAAHFSMQMWGLDKAKQWVSAWEEQYGGHVESVRLRMLRGALTLKQVDWQSDMIQMHAATILLRGNLTQNLNAVHIHDVEIHGVQWFLDSKVFALTDMMEVLPWQFLLQSAQSVQLYNMDITVQNKLMHKLPYQAMHFHGGTLSLAKQKWRLQGEFLSGSMELFGTSQQWQAMYANIDAVELSSILGLAPIPGVVSGHLQRQGDMLLSQTQWQHDEHAGSLNWDSHIFNIDDDWHVNLDVQNWPLQSFKNAMPMMQKHVLSEGYLNANMMLDKHDSGWRLSAAKAQVNDVRYQSNMANDMPEWTLKSMGLKKAILIWPERSFQVEHIELAEGVWGMNSALSQDLGEADAVWRLDAPNIQFSNMRVGSTRHDFWLTSLSGQAVWQHGNIHIHAKSASEQMGQWDIQFEGPLLNLQVNIQADDVPLLAFRDVLPVSLSQGSGLAGHVGLQLHGNWTVGRLQGDMYANDVMWNRGSWLWRAKHMDLHAVEIMPEKAFKVKLWTIEDWAGQTSLQPFSAITALKLNENTESKSLFYLADWHIEEIRLGTGSFSLGQADHVWFESKQVLLTSIQPEHVMTVDVQGILAEGDFSLRGEWFPWGEAAWFNYHAYLDQALPFVAMPWLKASALPVLNRGKFSAQISIENDVKNIGAYQALTNIQVNGAHFKQASFSNDAWLNLMSYAPETLLERIAPYGDFQLNVPMYGLWQEQGFTWSRWSEGILMALKNKAAVDKPMLASMRHSLSNVRLHRPAKDSLQYNERVRLRKVMRKLWQHKTWRLELLPQLGNAVFDADLLQRVRSTQQQIESFLVRRGIRKERIFPVWPDESQRSGESTGILLQGMENL